MRPFSCCESRWCRLTVRGACDSRAERRARSRKWAVRCARTLSERSIYDRFERDACCLDRRDQRVHVHLHPGDSAGVRGHLLHGAHQGRADPLYQGHVHPADGEEARERREIHLVVSGPHGVHRLARGHGQHRRHRHGRGHRRPGCHLLDVGDGAYRCRFGLHRVHAGPDLQDPRQGGRVPGRSGLLHPAGPGPSFCVLPSASTACRPST